MEHNPNWGQILDNLYRILTTEGKTNILLI